MISHYLGEGLSLQEHGDLPDMGTALRPMDRYTPAWYLGVRDTHVGGAFPDRELEGGSYMGKGLGLDGVTWSNYVLLEVDVDF